MDNMENTGKRDKLTKILAIGATIILWLPFAFMIITSIFGSIAAGKFLMDYLIPAELFPMVIVGGAILIWVSIRSKLMRESIIIDFIVTVVSFFAVQAIAVLSGIASGAAAAAGLYWWLIIAVLVLYVLAALGLAICGILLIRRLRQ